MAHRAADGSIVANQGNLVASPQGVDQAGVAHPVIDWSAGAPAAAAAPTPAPAATAPAPTALHTTDDLWGATDAPVRPSTPTPEGDVTLGLTGLGQGTIGPAPQSYVDSQGPMGAFNALEGHFEDAITGGWAAKGAAALRGGLSALSGGDASKAYTGALNGYQADLYNEAQAHPGFATAGDVGGMISQGAFLPEAKAAGVAGRIAQGALAGGVLAGADSLGHARGDLPTELGQAIPATLEGAAGGGVLNGLLGPGITRAASGANPNGLLSPFMARASQRYAQNQAGQIIANRASDLPAVQASLADGAQSIVPGSVPTTFQQTGDPGLGALERGVSVRHPEDFATRRGDQNQARVDSLASIQSGADPMALQSHISTTLGNLDAQTQAHVDALTTQAQQSGAAVGGHGNPEDYGSALRDNIVTAQNAAKARESGLWNAIDPNGDLTANTVATSQAAKAISSDLPSTAKPMSGEEDAIFHAAQGLPAIAPARDLIALRGRLNAEMANELATAGRTPAYARMVQLRGALEDNLANTVSDAVKQPETAAQIKAWSDAQQQPVAAANVGGGGNQPMAGGGSPPQVGVGGATFPTGGQFAGIAGNQGLSAVPTFDAEAASRLAAANQTTKDRGATFGLQPVASVTASTGRADQFRLPDGNVPGKFFHPGPTGYGDMHALFRAGGQDQSLPVIQDFAASSLRKSAMNPDGTIDPTRFGRWQAAHADAIRALPADTQARFASAASATQAVADAAVSRDTAIKAAQASAVGRLLGATDPSEVTTRVGKILSSPSTAVGDMTSLANAASNNPNAVQGLRQAVADHIAGRFIGNTEAGTSGTAQIKADAFQTFVRTNHAALGKVFTPEEIGNLQAIAADIQRSNRSVNGVRLPGGSNTAQDMYATGNAAGKQTVAGLVTHSLLDSMGVALGEHFGGTGGAIIGGTLGTTASATVNALRAQGIQRVDDLVTKAMLNPVVARALLQRVGAGQVITPTSGPVRALLRALTAAQAQSASRSASGGPPPNGLLAQ